MLKMNASLNLQSKHGIMAEEEESLGFFSSFSEDSSSSSSDLTEDTADSSSASSPLAAKRSLFDMSSLKAELPFKRGLSRYYQGKSQSFISFSEVRCLEELAKPERPLKKLKLSKSYGERSVPSSSGLKPKKASSAARRYYLRGCSKSPIPPQRPTTISDHTLWFA